MTIQSFPDYEYVGFWPRFGASMIDSLIIVALVYQELRPVLHPSRAAIWVEVKGAAARMATKQEQMVAASTPPSRGMLVRATERRYDN